jgi:hypothetical protein
MSALKRSRLTLYAVLFAAIYLVSSPGCVAGPSRKTLLRHEGDFERIEVSKAHFEATGFLKAGVPAGTIVRLSLLDGITPDSSITELESVLGKPVSAGVLGWAMVHSFQTKDGSVAVIHRYLPPSDGDTLAVTTKVVATSVTSVLTAKGEESLRAILRVGDVRRWRIVAAGRDPAMYDVYVFDRQARSVSEVKAAGGKISEE